jgi:hypothetical protein
MYAWVGPFACGKVIVPDTHTHAHMQTNMLAHARTAVTCLCLDN